MLSEFRVVSLIKNRCELVIYPEGKFIYLKKNFRQNLNHDVKIELDPDDPKSILIIEVNGDESKSRYYDAALVKRLRENNKINGRMKFIVLKDETENGIWRAKLLPDLASDYFEWHNKTNIAYYHDNDYYKNILISALKYVMYGMVEAEEIEDIFNIGYHMVLSEKKYIGWRFWYYVLMSAYNMLNEIRAELRKCKRCESSFSLDDKPNKMQDFYTFGCVRGAEDTCFSHLVVEEFINKLTEIEKFVLALKNKNVDWLCCDDIGHHLKRLIIVVTEKLKAKAIEYFGADYINSILVMENKIT